MTTFDGQRATVQSQDQHFYVTAVKAQQLNGQTVYTPQTENFATGFRMTVRPTVTPDHRSVVLALDAELRELTCNPVPLFPVTTFITPVFEGGAQGQPTIPFTQFIQQPTVQTRREQGDGHSRWRYRILLRWLVMRTEKSVCSTPVLGVFRSSANWFTEAFDVRRRRPPAPVRHPADRRAATAAQGERKSWRCPRLSASSWARSKNRSAYVRARLRCWRRLARWGRVRRTPTCCPLTGCPATGCPTPVCCR